MIVAEAIPSLIISGFLAFFMLGVAVWITIDEPLYKKLYSSNKKES